MSITTKFTSLLYGSDGTPHTELIDCINYNSLTNPQSIRASPAKSLRARVLSLEAMETAVSFRPSFGRLSVNPSPREAPFALSFVKGVSGRSFCPSFALKARGNRSCFSRSFGRGTIRCSTSSTTETASGIVKLLFSACGLLSFFLILEMLWPVNCENVWKDWDFVN